MERRSPIRSKKPEYVDRRDKMTVAEIYDDVVGVHELAEVLGVSLFRLRRWIERRESNNCPNRIKRITSGNLYSASEWKEWFAVWKITRGAETWQKEKQKPPPKLFKGVEDD